MPISSAAKAPRLHSNSSTHAQATGARKGPCKGYVIDHIVPLACHGADAPSNMQWQTVSEGKAKDKWERKVWEVILLVTTDRGIKGKVGVQTGVRSAFWRVVNK